VPIVQAHDGGTPIGGGELFQGILAGYGPSDLYRGPEGFASTVASTQEPFSASVAMEHVDGWDRFVEAQALASPTGHLREGAQKGLLVELSELARGLGEEDFWDLPLKPWIRQAAIDAAIDAIAPLVEIEVGPPGSFDGNAGDEEPFRGILFDSTIGLFGLPHFTPSRMIVGTTT
jgi:hypothetical protein